jgi:hypothetical protein
LNACDLDWSTWILSEGFFVFLCMSASDDCSDVFPRYSVVKQPLDSLSKQLSAMHDEQNASALLDGGSNEIGSNNRLA